MMKLQFIGIGVKGCFREGTNPSPTPYFFWWGSPIIKSILHAMTEYDIPFQLQTQIQHNITIDVPSADLANAPAAFGVVVFYGYTVRGRNAKLPGNPVGQDTRLGVANFDQPFAIALGVTGYTYRSFEFDELFICGGCHCSGDEVGSDDARNFRKTHY
jgi:hypothetical protein